MHGMDWDDFRLLLEIARAGSLSAAAVRLRINQSTVSRRLSQLEHVLQCRLVERSVTGITLTDAGADLFRMAEQMEEDVADQTAALVGRDRQVSGRLTITCVDMMVDRFLAPHLSEFATKYPEIELVLRGSMQPVNLMRNEAEVALRISANPHEVLVGRMICDFALAVYVARKYLTGTTQPDWIGWTDGTTAAQIMARHFPDITPRHIADNYPAVNAMVRAGLGAAMLPCYWADRDADLVRINPDTVPAGLGLWVLIHPDKSRVARIRAFVDFIQPRLKAYRDLFEGEEKSA